MELSLLFKYVKLSCAVLFSSEHIFKDYKASVFIFRIMELVISGKMVKNQSLLSWFFIPAYLLCSWTKWKNNVIVVLLFILKFPVQPLNHMFLLSANSWVNLLLLVWNLRMLGYESGRTEGKREAVCDMREC